jgi:hypothetical protein
LYGRSAPRSKTNAIDALHGAYASHLQLLQCMVVGQEYIGLVHSGRREVNCIRRCHRMDGSYLRDALCDALIKWKHVNLVKQFPDNLTGSGLVFLARGHEHFTQRDGTGDDAVPVGADVR